MITVDAVSHAYRTSGQRDVVAARHVCLEIARGEFCVIVGPSGCGKSTLLRIVAGLTAPTRGSVTIGGRPVTGPSPEAAVVFQDYSRSMFPWLTVEGNVALARRSGDIESPGVPDIAGLLVAVALAADRHRYPWQLSGGMQQRVAIARALARRPAVLLMDEPFGSLDALTRYALEDLVLETHRRFGLTTLMVTHDVDEAIYMADRIFVMDHDGGVRIPAGMTVSLPHPRHQATTRLDGRFAALRRELLNELGVLRPVA